MIKIVFAASIDQAIVGLHAHGMVRRQVRVVTPRNHEDIYGAIPLPDEVALMDGWNRDRNSIMEPTLRSLLRKRGGRVEDCVRWST